jgi:iron complex transport system ATP-binding protein
MDRPSRQKGLYLTAMNPAPQQTVIRTTGLSIGYRKGGVTSTLFEDLELTLHRGQLTCFMGPNGIGKSTLIRTLLGVQPPLTGRVEFVDDTSSRLSTLQPSKKLAAVLTDRISALNMDVAELVAFGRYPYLGWGAKLGDEDHQMVLRSIRQVRIEHLSAKKIYELSDGQLQLAMIARALAQDTAVILLDEPTAHLDLNNRLEIMNLLRNLAHDLKKAVLVATHELDLALQTADTIWLAGKGKGILSGVPEDLVLNGAFDDVFKFKGYDLKTGRIRHEVSHVGAIQLQGNGHTYLWTKNALERSGFFVSPENAPHILKLVSEGAVTTWNLDGTRFNTLEDLLHHLKRNFARQ